MKKIIFILCLFLISLISYNSTINDSSENNTSILFRFVDFGYNDNSVLIIYSKEYLTTKETFYGIAYSELLDNKINFNNNFIPESKTKIYQARLCKKDSSIFYTTDNAIVKMKLNNLNKNEVFSYSNSIPYLSKFSNDSEKLIVLYKENNQSDIFLLNYEGVIKKITNDEDFERYPEFSNDCSQMTFQSTKDSKTSIIIMNIDGTNKKNITTLSGSINKDQSCPIFSNDDAKILFINKDILTNKLYLAIINSDGTQEETITDTSSIPARSIDYNNYYDYFSWLNSDDNLYFQTLDNPIGFINGIYKYNLLNKNIIPIKLGDKLEMPSATYRFSKLTNNIICTGNGSNYYKKIILYKNLNFNEAIVLGDIQLLK